MATPISNVETPPYGASIGLQARSTFDEIIDVRNLNLKIAMESNEVNAILNILRKSNYVTVLSETVVLEQEGLVTVDIENAQQRSSSVC